MKLMLKVCLFVISIFISISAQTVNVGKGSYTTILPSGAVGPQTFSGAVAVPKISSNFQKPPQTCDFWSSLIYPFYGSQYSNVIYAHPLNLKAESNGLKIGHTKEAVFAAQDYLFPFYDQLTVGIVGLNAPKTVASDYGDWTAEALWENGSKIMRATFGHGLPFVYFQIEGGNALITNKTTPSIWFNQNGVIGMTVSGIHYGVFAPHGSTWSGTTSLQSSLNGNNYFSIALLPDNNLETLETFRKHAYAFVTDSKVSWQYDEQNAKLNSTFTYTTELKETANDNVNQTLTALYRHHYINTNVILTNYEYNSVAGKMKLFEGNEFTTELTFEGVLPALPDEGDYNKTDLLEMINDVATETLPSTGNSAGTYWNGKAIARFAHLVNIADQIGAVAARDHFLSEIKTRLEDWFTADGNQKYVYNSTWRTLTGYPSEFGADNQLNDHNFHSGYAIMGAAIVAQYDPDWALQENWGGMVNLLIKDGNNHEREDERFPFLRALDAYAGHSWESGHGDFGDGNNEESSSESMNFATAVILWGEITNQKDIRDLGIFLYTTERSAIEQYWFDIDDEVFPNDYPYTALGMVWGGKGVHSTWFGNNPDFIHGINMLPYNGGSLYLGRNPEYVMQNYQEIIEELNGVEPTWKDIIWKYLALAEPGNALALFYADPNYEPEAGDSKAHTYHWLGNLKRMGKLDVSVTADIPTYSVLKSLSGKKTYIAYNAKTDSVIVNYSDGFSMKVPPRQLLSFNSDQANADAPVAVLIADKTSGKSPLKINFTGSKSFDPNDSELTYEWNFDDGTLSDSADLVHEFSEVGSYNVTFKVTNQLMLSKTDSITITVLGNGTPYFGQPFQVPGLIEAENYDKGGEGIAYHDVDPNNIGLAYRPNEGVDLEASNDQGFDVYWMVAGEWLEYTINVNQAGLYDILSYVSSVPGFGNFRILINNEDVSGKRQVGNTGGWQSWTPITVKDVQLEEGTQILRFEVNTDHQSELKNWLYSLNKIRINYAESTGINDNENLPLKFSLEQNYPNPFNPSTIIRYSVPSNEYVSLKLFDVLGNEISTLVNEQKSAGNYEIKFNANNLASGIYFYKMTAGSFRSVKKLLLLK